MPLSFKPKVLIVRGAFGEMYEPAWYRALRDLGIRVEIFDCHEKTPKNIFGRLQRRFLWGPSIEKLREDLINHIEKYRPEIVLLYQGHYIDSETVKKISEFSFVTGYHNDNPYGEGAKMLRYRHFHKAISSYDAFHVYRPSNISQIKKAGIKRVSVLMPGFMPWIDYPRKLNTKEIKIFESEVLFIGHCENDQRNQCLLELLNNRLKLKIFGDSNSWKEFGDKKLLIKVPKIIHLTGDNYRKAISAAKINLCFFSKKNKDVYTRRVFEITACAGFLLCERTPEMLELFPEGIAAEYFDNSEELLEKTKFYLKNFNLRKKIANQGFKLVHQNKHDIYSRMIDWLKDIEKWQHNTSNIKL